MIYDCFTFFNELEILEIRLRELGGVVDRFILVEATRTFSNEPKPLFYKANKRHFGPWNSRITHVVVDDMPQSSNPWVLEQYQRNAITRGLADCEAEDVILISDVDEIPPARWVAQLNDLTDVLVCLQRQAYYLLNNISNYPLSTTRAVSYRQLQSLGGAQAVRAASGQVIPDCGWHFSYMGGVHAIKNKLRSYSHQEYNTAKYTDLSYIGRMVQDKSDLFDRPIDYYISDVSELPEYVQKNKTRYYDWIYESPFFYESSDDDEQCQRLIEIYERVRGLAGDVVEIGCREGRRTVALANTCFPGALLAVDTWEGSAHETGSVGGDSPQERDMFRKFMRNIRVMTAGNVQPIVSNSHRFFERHSNPIKFCHIDGSHDYGIVRNAIEGALTWLVRGGILCGDDQGLYASAVLRAVQNLLPGFTRSGKLWFWQHP